MCRSAQRAYGGTGKAMKFLVSEGIDDSCEGTMIAEGIGNAVKAFGGVLPEGIYNNVVGIEV